jgi:transcriptional regulator with PAS, ATPase and Fis domain
MEQVARLVAVAVDNVLHDESAQAAQRQLKIERDLLRALQEQEFVRLGSTRTGR